MGTDIEEMMRPMMSMFGLVMMGAIVVSILPVRTTYTCPICGEVYYSIADLEAHFTSAHPSEPIEIIWA